MDPAAVLNIVVNAHTGKAVAEIQAVDKQLKTTAATTSAATGRIAKAAKWGGAALAVGVAAGLVKSVKAANAFESSFAEVRKTVDASEKGFDRLESGLRRLARTIPINVNELNDLAGQAGALGIKSKDIVRFTRTAAELGIATDMSASDAANALARLSNIMGTSSKDFRRLGSSFVALGNDGASTEREISDMALRLAATGKQVGLNEAQVLSFSSALASVGIEAEAGGSAFSRAFSQMSEAVATGGEKLKGFAEVAGMGEGGFSQLFEKNAAQAMIRFVEGLGRIKKEGGNALVTLKDLDINEVRLRNSLLSAAGAGKLFREQMKVGNQAWKENSALTNEARERYDTMDSKIKLLGNRANDLAITVGQKLDPVVRGVTDALLALTSGNFDKWLDRMAKKSQTASDIVDVLRASWKVLSAVIATVVAFARGRIEAFLQIIRSILKIFKNVVVLVKALVNGDWKGAWNAFKGIVSGAVGVVKGVVKGMLSPLKAAFIGIRTLITNIAGGAWRKVESIFRDGANAVIDVVNGIINVLNKIPGVDIGKVGRIAANLDHLSADPNGKSLGRQRGGTIQGGKPSGDSIPAMLERGEYVLNRNAVRKVGVDRLNQLNFKHASRFQSGGPVGMIGGGLADAAGNVASGVAGAAAGMAGKVLGKGAGWFIKRLPDPNLPQPFTGTGPWLIEHVEEWIKGKVPKLGGPLGNVSGSLGQAMALAQSMGLTITSTTGGTHAPTSYHYSGRAFDASNSSGPTPEMHNYFMAAASRWGGKMLELFYDPIGWYIKHGSKVSGAIGDHSDHVHTAMQKGGIVGLIKGGLVKHPWFDKSTKKGNINGVWPSADLTKNPSGWHALPTLPPYVFGALAEAAGRHFGINVPGRAMMQMIMHEGGTPEGGKPGSRGTDPGGTVGYGPWAITTTFNDALVKRFGGSYAAMNNPVLNAAAMAHIVRDQGLGAWYGDQYVTDRSAHWRGKYQLRNALGGIGYSAALRSALRGKFDGDERGQDSGPSPAQQRKSRKGKREQQVRDLIQKAFGTRSVKAKKGNLWQILDLYAKYGDFGSRPGGTVAGGVAPGQRIFEAVEFLTRAKGIAGIVDPNRGAGQLYNLVKWLQSNVPLTGAKEANEALSKRLAAVRERSSDRAAAKRKKLLSKISGKGLDYPQKKNLTRNDRIVATVEEWIALAEREHSSETSAGGSEYTDAEVDYEKRLNLSLLGSLRDRKGMIARSIKYITNHRNALMEQLKTAPAFKRAAIRKGIANSKQTLGGLRTNWEELVGLTGRGGRIGDVKHTLAELGVRSTVEKEAMAGISIGDLLQIVEFAKHGGYDQLPKFHGGGVVPGPRGTEVPIMAQAGETVVPSGGLGDVKVEVNFADGMGWLSEFVDVKVIENDRKRDNRMKAGVR